MIVSSTVSDQQFKDLNEISNRTEKSNDYVDKLSQTQPYSGQNDVSISRSNKIKHNIVRRNTNKEICTDVAESVDNCQTQTQLSQKTEIYNDNAIRNMSVDPNAPNNELENIFDRIMSKKLKAQNKARNTPTKARITDKKTSTLNKSTSKSSSKSINQILKPNIKESPIKKCNSSKVQLLIRNIEKKDCPLNYSHGKIKPAKETKISDRKKKKK